MNGRNLTFCTEENEMKNLIWMAMLMAACLLPAFCLADLHDPNNSADYMIVTTQQLINDYP